MNRLYGFIGITAILMGLFLALLGVLSKNLILFYVMGPLWVIAGVYVIYSAKRPTTDEKTRDW